jgi:hypothetical protein
MALLHNDTIRSRTAMSLAGARSMALLLNPLADAHSMALLHNAPRITANHSRCDTVTPP